MPRLLRRASAAAALLLLPLSACAQEPEAVAKDYLGMTWDQIVAEAKAEGEVVFSAWWGEEYWKEAARLFEEKYGIEARHLMGNNPIDKILAEKDRRVGTIDVQLVGGAAVKTSMDAALWYGPIAAKLPASPELDRALQTAQEGVETKGHLIPIYRNQTGFLYDPEKVPVPPQTWDEFTAWVQANPKGFAYPDPNKGGTGGAFVQAVIANLTGGLDRYTADTALDPAKTAEWTEAWDWLKTGNEKMNVTLSNSEDIDLLNQGTASLVIAWDDDAQNALAKGSLFKRAAMYVPRFGLPGGGDTAGVPRNAPNKAAGLLFLDFLTSRQMQALMNRTVGSTPARTDMTESPSIISEESRANGTAWMPAPYKEAILKGFTENVLLQ
ncbi:LysR family transcriptional regulator [Acrocarpospora corrugata]|uniref:LysR family transcriptional regulator n=1 Tax=Acrocarpospora corrugata TaxID=35763 RepID=A0A5M3W5A4_9ACTN|nr:extracellular solute-binding protein [Acrocarpospora corrugata]GES01718.1 LysR family transcriptional regulator [Acrocarpospora corrugata]